VSLPAGVQASIAPLTTAVGEIYRYIIEAPAGMSENDIRALQDWVIRPELRIVSGVADVVSFGGTIKEYQVQVDPNLLKRYAVTLDQVNQALANNNSNVGGGTI
ncbi:efflux RND transporter permease subunit, partial [Undibacterium luofuense]